MNSAGDSLNSKCNAYDVLCLNIRLASHNKTCIFLHSPLLFQILQQEKNWAGSCFKNGLGVATCNLL